MNVLALNAGSTSLKFRFGGAGVDAFYKGTAQGFGGPDAKLEVTNTEGVVVATTKPATLEEAARAVLGYVRSDGRPVNAIGHRFVHGGPELRAHRRIDAAVRNQLDQASGFAPLHNPPALAVLASADAVFPDAPQVACLDTAFHATMPEASTRLPLPIDRLRSGLQRYGFHGLSCESIVRQLGSLPARLVIAHLGGGTSVTAVLHGKSVDTTMGLTPDGGVIMETRSGDLDPGLLIYLLRHGETVDSLEQLLNKASGIAGISGHGGDLRDLRTSQDHQSRLAIDMFAISVAKAIAGMAVVLGGLEMIVFTGGIGEHDADLRETIAARVAFIGHPSIRVLAAEEECEIIRHTTRLLS
jgi:acetate kinase